MQAGTHAGTRVRVAKQQTLPAGGRGKEGGSQHRIELSNGTDLRETLKCRTGRERSFTMSSEAQRGSPLKIIIGIALVVVIGLGAGYYYASGLVDRQIVTWSVNPVQIKFSVSQSYSGSVQDSFTCDPSVSPVTLQATSSQPDKITITVSPTSFVTCGSTPDNVTITASCTPTAIANGTCPGDRYTG